MPPGLFTLIEYLVVAAVVYYVSTIVPSPLVQKLGQVIAAIIAVIALLNFLRPLLGA